MALKKPSDYFKKDIPTIDNALNKRPEPESTSVSEALNSFKSNLSKIETLSEFSETLDNYRVNVERINYLSESIDSIQKEIENHLTQDDLDRALVSQLLMIEEGISEVQDKVKAINDKSLTEIRLDVSQVAESVNRFLQIEAPKYKKLIVDSDFRAHERHKKLEEELNETLEGIGDFVNNKYEELIENLKGVNEDSLSGILEDFKTLDKIVTEFKNNEIPKYKGFIVETERKTEIKLDEFQNQLDVTVSSLLEKVNSVEGDKQNLVEAVNENIKGVQALHKSTLDNLKVSEDYKKELTKKVAELEVGILRNENHIKKQNSNLKQIQENVKSELNRLNLDLIEEKNYELGKKIKYLEEVFEKFNEKEILTEQSIITEPPSTDNKDPLTPLNQNFVTLDQLQSHYRLFINRIQQQLSTLGGGGETRFEFLDDVDRDSVKQDGYFLKYDAGIKKIVGAAVAPGGGGGESYWAENGVGIHTTSNIGIGTTSSDSLLTVETVLGIDVSTVSVATTSPTIVYSFPSTKYRSSKLQAQITQGSEYQVSELLLLHNGSNSDITEISSLVSTEYLGNFSVEVVGSDVNVNVIMDLPDISTVKVVSYKITV